MNLSSLLTKLNPFKKKDVPEEPVFPEGTIVEVREEKPKKINMKDAPYVKQTHKLSEQDKQIIVSIFASGCTPTETSDRVREEFNIEVNPTVIAQYGRSEKWQPLIRKVREAHMNDLAAVSGSHKRVRLERHEKVYEKALKKGDMRNAITATVEQRKEMEGDGSINMTLNQFNTMSDDELEHKKKVVMERIELMTKQKEKK